MARVLLVGDQALLALSGDAQFLQHPLSWIRALLGATCLRLLGTWGTPLRGNLAADLVEDNGHAQLLT
jgi:hypothetical protein